MSRVNDVGGMEGFRRSCKTSMSHRSTRTGKRTSSPIRFRVANTDPRLPAGSRSTQARSSSTLKANRRLCPRFITIVNHRRPKPSTTSTSSGTPDPYGPEPGIGDQLFNRGARRPVGSAIERVGRGAVDDWSLDLLPSVRVERSVVRGPGSALYGVDRAVHVFGAHVVGCIDHQLAVERARKT
jgi:hypothetical protein